MKFKIGDKVKRINNDWDYKDQVVEVTNNIGGWLRFKEVAQSWNADNFELVTEPTMKFKIGDKVKRKPEQQNGEWKGGSKVYEVTYIYPHFIYFEEFGGGWYPENFDLVEEPPAKEVPFSIGDIVKLKDTTYYDGTYKVQAIDDYTESVKVEGVNVWFHADELEIAPIPVKTKADELREYFEYWSKLHAGVSPNNYSTGFYDGMKFMLKNALEILNKK